ncbi:hypothetical protein LINGRAHAP2_LOCUS15365, partial [Linum grandiflorum]
MNFSQSGVHADGFSGSRPPKFEGSHFSTWKSRMELFIMTYNPALWVIVKDGPKEVKTNYDKWTDDDIKKGGRCQ